jgi:hypothetical protein
MDILLGHFSWRPHPVARSFPRFEHVHNVADFPKAVGYFRGHRWRGAQLLMDTNEIVVHGE